MPEKAVTPGMAVQIGRKVLLQLESLPGSLLVDLPFSGRSWRSAMGPEAPAAIFWPTDGATLKAAIWS
jgi:hypothetical protein